MFDQDTIHHHIQKHILSVLLKSETARFRDLRPLSTDSNIFNYHLKQLVKAGYLKKLNNLYTLDSDGLRYVDRVNASSVKLRQQPKIITMLVVVKDEGEILLQKRAKQPYINTWTLPYGKLHIEESIQAAATREADEKCGIQTDALRHVGDCYIRAHRDTEVISSTLAHIFVLNWKKPLDRNDLVWALPAELERYRLAPAVKSIIELTLTSKSRFFEEFVVDW